MATKADRTRAESQRKGISRKRARKLAQRKPKNDHEEPIAAGKKATYAKESAPAAGKRPSRKSTRSSANRAKSDSNLTLRAERKKASPDDRARTAKAKAKRTPSR